MCLLQWIMSIVIQLNRKWLTTFVVFSCGWCVCRSIIVYSLRRQSTFGKVLGMYEEGNASWYPPDETTDRCCTAAIQPTFIICTLWHHRVSTRFILFLPTRLLVVSKLLFVIKSWRLNGKKPSNVQLFCSPNKMATVGIFQLAADFNLPVFIAFAVFLDTLSNTLFVLLHLP